VFLRLSLGCPDAEVAYRAGYCVVILLKIWVHCTGE
jgi:hypothetical protein